MPDIQANLSTDYLFPKLHGVWARSVVGEALDRLVHSGHEDAVGRALQPLGIDVTRRAEVQRQLVARLIRELAAIRRLTDPRHGAFYAAFIDRYFFENLKTVLHYHFFPEHGVSIRFLLIDAPELPTFDADALLAARNVNQLYRHIPEHPCREALLPLLVELEDTRDLQAAEGTLDGWFYRALLAAAERLPRSSRGVGRELVRTEIDIVNLVMVLRNVVLYRLPPEALRRLCVAGGRQLPPARLDELCTATSVAAAVARLPKPLRPRLEPLVEAELHLTENALWNGLASLAYDYFTDYNRPAASVVAFAFLKRFETLNIGRVFEGVHFGLGATDIQEMMIGAGHV